MFTKMEGFCLEFSKGNRSPCLTMKLKNNTVPNTQITNNTAYKNLKHGLLHLLTSHFYAMRFVGFCFSIFENTGNTPYFWVSNIHCKHFFQLIYCGSITFHCCKYNLVVFVENVVRNKNLDVFFKHNSHRN